MNANIVFIMNLVSTWYMVGLIWMVQVVHYKMFDRVGEAGFSQYAIDHSRLITPIVIPPMLVELSTACLLITFAPNGFPRTAAVVGLLIVILIWLSTFFLQVPSHHQLANGFDADAYRQLVNRNWIRTVLWSARGILMSYFAIRLLARH